MLCYGFILVGSATHVLVNALSCDTLSSQSSWYADAVQHAAKPACQAGQLFFWSGQVTRAESRNREPPLKRAGKRRVQPSRHPPATTEKRLVNLAEVMPAYCTELCAPSALVD